MKIIQMVMATSHVDLHGEIISHKSLESLVDQINSQYLPINVNHDIRGQPIGRLISAEIINLPDGEIAVLGKGELFEKSDNLESLRGDGRRIKVKCNDIETILVSYDRSFDDSEGKELIRELSEISKEEPIFALKKAFEPIPTLVISAGAFIVGAIATGFLRRIGYDLYDKLKQSLIKYYKKQNTEQLLDFCFLMKEGSRFFETHVLVDNPTEQKLNELFTSNFKNVDVLLVSLPLDKAKDISQLVLQYKEKKLVILYAVRNDAVPFTFKKFLSG